MANVRLNWTLSTPTAQQRALKHVLIDARVSASLPWGPINTVLAPTSTLLIQDPAPGTWEYRATVVDVGNVSDPTGRTVSITVPPPAQQPPSPVTAFTAVIE